MELTIHFQNGRTATVTVTPETLAEMKQDFTGTRLSWPSSSESIAAAADPMRRAYDQADGRVLLLDWADVLYVA